MGSRARKKHSLVRAGIVALGGWTPIVRYPFSRFAGSRFWFCAVLVSSLYSKVLENFRIKNGDCSYYRDRVTIVTGEGALQCGIRDRSLT